MERLVLSITNSDSTLQNDINEHWDGPDARVEFEQLEDINLEDFEATREEAERPSLEEERRQMQALEQDITVTGEQVGELASASEIDLLIIRINELEVAIEKSKKERQESILEVLFLSLLLNHSSID